MINKARQGLEAGRFAINESLKLPLLYPIKLSSLYSVDKWLSKLQPIYEHEEASQIIEQGASRIIKTCNANDLWGNNALWLFLFPMNRTPLSICSVSLNPYIKSDLVSIRIYKGKNSVIGFGSRWYSETEGRVLIEISHYSTQFKLIQTLWISDQWFLHLRCKLEEMKHGLESGQIPIWSH